MNIILFGPPAAGKGTQADNIVKDFSLHKISTGELLRNEVKNDTSLGKKIKSILEKGSLVSDEIIADLISKILSNKFFFNRLIFDGYPRNLNQAKSLNFLINKHNQKISCVLCLNVSADIIVKRVLGRQVCSKCSLTFNEFFNPSTTENHKCGDKFLKKRSDDNEKTIKSRLETYNKVTSPIINYYSEQKMLHQINGMRKIEEIYEEIRGIIASLEA